MIPNQTTGEVSLASTAVNDGTNFYITNTSGMDRLLTFTSFTGAFLRNGGAEADENRRLNIKI